MTFLRQAYLGENEFIADMAPTSDGAYYYAVGLENYYGIVTVATRDAVTGELTVIQTIEEDASSLELFGRFDRIVVSPDDAYVYVAVKVDGNPGPLNPGIWVFARDPGTGLLTQVQHVNHVSLSRGVFYVSDFRLSPDEQRVFVVATTGPDGSNVESRLMVFDRDASSGELTLSVEYGDQFDIPGLQPGLGSLGARPKTSWVAARTRACCAASRATAVPRLAEASAAHEPAWPGAGAGKPHPAKP